MSCIHFVQKHRRLLTV